MVFEGRSVISFEGQLGLEDGQMHPLFEGLSHIRGICFMPGFIL
jgi:hypothetical protein